MRANSPYARSTSTSDHVSMDNGEPDAKRRKLRKGTRSCWECKRRKVKCEFTLPTDEICIACRRRGGHCVSQEFPEETAHQEPATDNQGHLADRLLRVESLLSQLVKHVGDGSTRGSVSETGVLTPSPTVLSESMQQLQHSPEFSAIEPTPFCIVQQAYRQPVENQNTVVSKNRSISEALCAAFPSQQDIDRLCRTPVDSTIYLHRIWFDPDIDLSPRGKDIMASVSGPPSPEMHPVLLAKRMLTTALLLQYFPPGSNHSFSEEPRFMTQRLAEEAIKLVTTNESLHGWIESLEGILLEALYHSNFGNLRRAWLAVRRALSVAQLMGLDHSPSNRFRVLEPSRKIHPQFMWHNIVYQDRYFSLILGLPCGVVDDMTEYESTIKPGLSGSSWLQLELQHSRIVKRLLNRGNVKDVDADVDELDNMLLGAAKSVPDSFWVSPNFEGPDDGQGAFWRTIRAMNQVKHYSFLNCLHLPYLLREDSDAKYEHSKVTCLVASREILRRYNSYRGPKPTLSCCRPLDFVALLAALTVMVAQMNSHRPNVSYSFLSHQRPSDRQLIEQVLKTMDRVAQLNDDQMTFQSVCLLRRLMHIEADAHAGHCYLTEEIESADETGTKDRCTMDKCSVLHIDIPYFGTLRISRAANRECAQGSDQQTTAHPHNTTSELSGNSQLMVSPYLVSSGQIDFSLQPDGGAGFDSLQQTSYPDLTATVDDWAFQGVDSNFFGSIMSNGSFNFGNEEEMPASNWAQPFLSKTGDDFFKPRSFTN